MSRSIVQILGLAVALAFSAAAPVAAQSAPAAISGTLRYPGTNAAWGTFEASSTTSNTFGFSLRFRPSNGHVMTVVPFKTQADGSVACWYIEYNLIGAVDPNRTEGWQWQEVAGGQVVLNPATATSASIDGAIAQTYTMVAYTRQPEANPQFTPIRLTVP